MLFRARTNWNGSNLHGLERIGENAAFFFLSKLFLKFRNLEDLSKKNEKETNKTKTVFEKCFRCFQETSLLDTDGMLYKMGNTEKEGNDGVMLVKWYERLRFVGEIYNSFRAFRKWRLGLPLATQKIKRRLWGESHLLGAYYLSKSMWCVIVSNLLFKKMGHLSWHGKNLWVVNWTLMGFWFKNQLRVKCRRD